MMVEPVRRRCRDLRLGNYRVPLPFKVNAYLVQPVY
ncbi:hypothetical protein AHF37_09571 [Paragonimus kellicotti]|nr:hypothetical protein AHF37_09571 [Paragonimus kellicotti]